jgi:hypothetical protein
VPTAWLPYNTRDEVLSHLGALPSGIEVDVYTGDGQYPASIADLEFYVLPYMKGPSVLERAREMSNLKVVQTLTAGYEEFLLRLPLGAVLCNAAGVHDASTAELAIALTLASGRGLDEYARRQSERSWRPHFGTALADSRVLIIGYGNIGRAIEKRLAGFEPASVARVGKDCAPWPSCRPLHCWPSKTPASHRHRHPHRSAHARDGGFDLSPRALPPPGRGAPGERLERQAC